MKNILLPFVIDKKFREKVKNFVDTSEREYWIVNTTANTKNRFFCKISNLPQFALSHDIQNIKVQILKNLKVDNYLEEHMFGNFIGVNKEGGNVHTHTDPVDENGWLHTRFNCLIQKPVLGGMPVIDNIEYNIEEGQCWYNNASQWYHGSTPVQGTIDRIVMSLGVYLSPENFYSINTTILKN